MVETLLALLILVMLTGIVAMGIPVAKDTYEKAVNVSNAQVLLTTTTTELRNEFGLAQHVWTNNGEDATGTVESYLSGEGYWAKIVSPQTSANGTGLKKQVFYGWEHPGASATPAGTEDLVSTQAITQALRVTCGSITYADGVFTVHDLKVFGPTGSDPLADVPKYEVKALMLAN